MSYSLFPNEIFNGFSEMKASAEIRMGYVDILEYNLFDQSKLNNILKWTYKKREGWNLVFLSFSMIILLSNCLIAKCPYHPNLLSIYVIER